MISSLIQPIHDHGPRRPHLEYKQALWTKNRRNGVDVLPKTRWRGGGGAVLDLAWGREGVGVYRGPRQRTLIPPKVKYALDVNLRQWGFLRFNLLWAKANHGIHKNFETLTRLRIQGTWVPPLKMERCVYSLGTEAPSESPWNGYIKILNSKSELRQWEDNWITHFCVFVTSIVTIIFYSGFSRKKENKRGMERGGIRLKVGSQPLKVISPTTESWMIR